VGQSVVDPSGLAQIAQINKTEQWLSENEMLKRVIYPLFRAAYKGMGFPDKLRSALKRSDDWIQENLTNYDQVVDYLGEAIEKTSNFSLEEAKDVATKVIKETIGLQDDIAASEFIHQNLPAILDPKGKILENIEEATMKSFITSMEVEEGLNIMYTMAISIGKATAKVAGPTAVWGLARQVGQSVVDPSGLAQIAQITKIYNTAVEIARMPAFSLVGFAGNIYEFMEEAQHHVSDPMAFWRGEKSLVSQVLTREWLTRKAMGAAGVIGDLGYSVMTSTEAGAAAFQTLTELLGAEKNIADFFNSGVYLAILVCKAPKPTVWTICNATSRGSCLPKATCSGEINPSKESSGIFAVFRTAKRVPTTRAATIFCWFVNWDPPSFFSPSFSGSLIPTRTVPLTCSNPSVVRFSKNREAKFHNAVSDDPIKVPTECLAPIPRSVMTRSAPISAAAVGLSYVVKILYISWRFRITIATTGMAAAGNCISINK